MKINLPITIKITIQHKVDNYNYNLPRTIQNQKRKIKSIKEDLP